MIRTGHVTLSAPSTRSIILQVESMLVRQLIQSSNISQSRSRITWMKRI